MKKLIAILAITALVTGAAFAQLSGYAYGSMIIDRVDGFDDDGNEKVTAGLSGGIGRINLEGSATTEDGQFGVWMRFRGNFNAPVKDGGWSENVGAWGYVFWQPIQQVKFQIGTNPDNHFSADNITRWGFYSRICDVLPEYANNNYWNQWSVFSDYSIFGGWSNGGYGAILTISPVNFIDLTFAVPLAQVDEDEAEPWNNIGDAMKATVSQVAVAIPDVGRAFVTYEAGVKANEVGEEVPSGKLYVSFTLTAIEGLGIDIGGSFDFDDNAPIGLGLGAAFNTGAFEIKARVFTAFGRGNDGFNIAADLLPSFAINDTFKVFCSLGIVAAGFGPSWNPIPADETHVGFHVNPYIMASIGWDRNFYAGFRLWQDPAKSGDGSLRWQIPIGIVVGF